MAKLQGSWNTQNDQVEHGAKILNMMILEETDRLSRSSPDQYLVSESSFSISSSDLDDTDDANDLTETSDSSDGPLYELSELLLQLPIKRGLSKYYQGKSRSFKNVRNVKNVKEFAKEFSSKEIEPSRMRSYTRSPKAIICKKSTSSFPYLPSFSRR